MTSNSQQDNKVSSNTRCKPRNNGPDRTKSHTDTPKSGEINKSPSITPGPSGVNRNSLTTPGRAGPPIHNRQQTNHELSHNSIECYNCGKLGHIKPNCPEPLRARHIGAVHAEESPAGQVDNADLDINGNIDDEHPDEDKYCNDEYDNQLGQQTHHNLARIAAVVPIHLVNARKAKIAKEGESLYAHTVKVKTTRPAQSKHDLLMIAGYFLVGGTKSRCLFDSACEGIIMSSEFVHSSRVKLYYTVTTDITVGQQMYTEMFDIANIDYYDVMLGTPFLRRVKANIDFNGLGSIVINGEMIDNDLLVWLALEEAKVYGMSTYKATPQEEKPLALIVEQLSIRMKETSFEMNIVKNDDIVDNNHILMDMEPTPSHSF
ncbi:hypothetical protein M422DRAFT_262971 [Sphaerobolus stellatus SS14]|uniref:CCHC-type domain-containing protein n=1 Tax=Sphaerobolus stellatus (strain SS14) TaxID=990650 RepID=A0A0C9UZQ3_SPHS4|nr:hypothetical protein M422DRAFT_262971 [Sphaerobolus stellatus SS14]